MVCFLHIGETDACRCGHCKKLVPEYMKAAEHMMGIFTFAAVNCDDKENQALCAEFDIQEVPSIKFMKPSRGGLEAQGICHKVPD